MAKQEISVSKVFLWILMGLLFLGLAGFGATNLSGSVRSVGSVGEKDISIDSYFRALQREIRTIETQTSQPLTFQQAQAFGLPDQVLAQLVTSRAMDHEAAQMGLSVGDENLAEQLRSIPAFQGPDGQFSRDNYRFSLENAGLTEAEFEADLRDESARTLLQTAVIAGNAMPDIYVETLMRYALEERRFEWGVLDRNALSAEIPTPTEDDLKAFYDDNLALYTRGEAREITYAWLAPDMIVDTVEVEESLLRQAYEERSAEFNMPERRLVERLVFPDSAAAQVAADRIASGESTFENETSLRGLALTDIDLGDVTRRDLGMAADVVFDAEVGTVAGPAPSDLGPALYRINAVLPAQETTYEEALPDLRDALALDRARRVATSLGEGAEDLLAGGATLEELADDTELQLGTISWVRGETDEGIAGYPAFRSAAATVTTDDFPEIMELGDGGIFALRLNDITPPAPRPYEDVAEDVARDWEAAQVLSALEAEAAILVGRLGEAMTFEALNLALTQTQTVTRDARPQGLPSGAMADIFEMTAGEARAFPVNGRVAIVQLAEIIPADLDSEGAVTLREALENQAAGDVAQDLFSAMAVDIQGRAGISIDQQALNAVHANFQ